MAVFVNTTGLHVIFHSDKDKLAYTYKMFVLWQNLIFPLLLLEVKTLTYVTLSMSYAVLLLI